jgi:hypothetical protein
VYKTFGRRTIEKGLELGDKLIQVKDGSKHGDFMRIVQADFDLNHNTANYWMDKVRTKELEILNIKNLDVGVIETTAVVISDGEDTPYRYATNADEASANLEENIDTITLEETLDETNEDEEDIQESLFAPSITQNGSSNGSSTNSRQNGSKPKRTGRGGGGRPDGLLRGFYQIETVEPGRQTYAVFEKNPPLDSGRRFYLAGVESWPSGDFTEAYSYAFSESEIKGITQAWIRHCKTLGIDL